MAIQLYFSQLRAVDANGEPCPGALARFFVTGTTTPATVYADADLSIAHPSPLVADAAGVFPQVFAATAVKSVVTEADGSTIPGGTQDPCLAVSTTGTGAAQITFPPSAGIPESNVESAILSVFASIATTLAATGVGTTAPALLATFDNVVTGSGFYRFDATTAGTRPSGWDTYSGYLMVLTQSASARLEVAWRSDANAYAFRRYTGTWQAWVVVSHSGLLQLTATWEAGTSTDLSPVSPADVKAAVLANQPASFESTPQAVADTITVAHGLGARPKRIHVALRCTTAEHGYSINDEIDLSGYALDSDFVRISVFADATNVGWRASAAAWPRIITKATATAATPTTGSWRLIIRASL